MTVNRRRAVISGLAAASIALGGCSLFERHTAPHNGGTVREYLGAATRRNALPERVDPTPAVVWRAEAGRGSTGAPAVGDRITGLTTVDRRVVALDTRTGELFWQWRGGHTFAAGPVMGDGAMFIGSEGATGTLTSLALSSGRRNWYHRVGDVATPLVLRHGRVYGATTAGVVFAFDAESGRRDWMYRVSQTRSGVVVLGDMLAIVTTTDSLIVLEVGTGRITSRAALPATSISPPAVIDDSTIVYTAPTGAVVAVAVPAGRVRWQITTDGPAVGAPVVSRDTVFALTSTCEFWSIPLDAPAAATSVPLGCVTRAGPALVHDGVLVATVGGTVELHERPNGRLLWADTLRSELRHPPMVLNGQIVVAQTLGDVVSYR